MNNGDCNEEIQTVFHCAYDHPDCKESNWFNKRCGRAKDVASISCSLAEQMATQHPDCVEAG